MKEEISREKKKFDLCIMSYLIPVVIVGETKYLKKRNKKRRKSLNLNRVTNVNAI